MEQRLIRTVASPGRQVVIHPGNSSMRHIQYARIRLGAVQREVSFANEGQETGLICLKGSGTVIAGGQEFKVKADDAVYVPKGMSIEVRTESELDLVECSAPVDGEYPLQFVSGESVQTDSKLHFVAGTDAAHREINILFGTNVQAGRLVAGITRSRSGNWTSWPPHEHAAMLEEIYVFVDMPAPAFGLQMVYEDEITPAAVEVVREDDVVQMPAGYHPNVAIPGHQLNFVWIMAAHREVMDRQWGVVQVDPRFG